VDDMSLLLDWQQIPSPVRTPIGVLAWTIAAAEEQMTALPATGEAQALRHRLLALKTVTNGLFHGVPRLTEAQRARLGADARAVARDVWEMRARLDKSRAGG
jgi:hypothetical protein